MNQTKRSNTQTISTTAKLTITAMFGALAAILMLFELPIFFTLPFIKLDFSDIPVILGAYMLGPLWGCVIGLIKVALNFVLNGTVTGGIGELANLLFTLAYVLPAGFIYRFKRTKSGAVISLVVSILFASVFAVILDWILVFPVYMKAFHLDMEAILGMAVANNSLVKNEATLMWLSVFPANLLKYTCASIITFFVYSPLRKLINSVTHK
ncbi:MAG: ECF transporter S component [Lachnospiraceae bacterium]|nr:ECF transporter S component [Lachnospiraceae bacterium]